MTVRIPAILLLAGSTALVAPAPAAAADSIDLGGLLTEMLDRARIAEYPEPAFVCKQASSYNRESKEPGKPEWFATGDYSQFIRVEEVAGRREWVMMDVDGPGAIVRWWITQYKFDGTIRVYLDGSEEPALESTGDKLLGGAEGGLIGSPLAAMRSRGCNLYLPIPFRQSCKVTYDGKNALETKTTTSTTCSIRRARTSRRSRGTTSKRTPICCSTSRPRCSSRRGTRSRHRTVYKAARRRSGRESFSLGTSPVAVRSARCESGFAPTT